MSPDSKPAAPDDRSESMAPEDRPESTVAESDLEVIAAQLGRPPRGTRAVAHRCPCGLPDVVQTTPRLADGSPFPTLYYLTCPRAVAACSRLESTGTMREMNSTLAADPEVAEQYRTAHQDYLARRDALEPVPELDGVSAGGMPGRVKCLHALLAHSLAVGPGVNPFGDQTRDLAGQWWQDGPCVAGSERADPARQPQIVVRKARTADVPGIRRLIDMYTMDRRLLAKATVTLYEDVQEFWVASIGDTSEIVGCGALHTMWEDLAEIRTLAVDRDYRGHRIGARIVTELLATARHLGIRRVFVLTFEREFFARFGFVEVDGAPVPPAVYEQLLRSYDEGVAEFLDLDRVKPNILGNTRMLLHL